MFPLLPAYQAKLFKSVRLELSPKLKRVEVPALAAYSHSASVGKQDSFSPRMRLPPDNEPSPPNRFLSGRDSKEFRICIKSNAVSFHG